MSISPSDWIANAAMPPHERKAAISSNQLSSHSYDCRSRLLDGPSSLTDFGPNSLRRNIDFNSAANERIAAYRSLGVVALDRANEVSTAISAPARLPDIRSPRVGAFISQHNRYIGQSDLLIGSALNPQCHARSLRRSEIVLQVNGRLAIVRRNQKAFIHYGAALSATLAKLTCKSETNL
jgi:hypothetical protein